MGRRTVLFEANMTLGTGNVLAAFQTAAVNVAAAQARITRVEIGQSGTTTLEMIRAEIATRDTAGTLTMTATTPKAVRPVSGPASGLTGNTAPAGGTARSGTDSSADSGGTYTSVLPFTPFPNLNGMIWKPDPAEEIWIPPSTLAVVRLLATPTGTTGWTVAVYLDEE